MSRSSALILIGVLVILAPLSGLPQSWITVLLAILGIITVIIGIALRSEHVRHLRQSTPMAPMPAPAPMLAAEPEEAEIQRSTEHHAHERHASHAGPSSIA